MRDVEGSAALIDERDDRIRKAQAAVKRAEERLAEAKGALEAALAEPPALAALREKITKAAATLAETGS